MIVTQLLSLSFICLGPFSFLPYVKSVVVVAAVVAVVVVVHCQYRRMMLFADCIIITSKVERILMRLTKIGSTFGVDDDQILPLLPMIIFEIKEINKNRRDGEKRLFIHLK